LKVFSFVDDTVGDCKQRRRHFEPQYLRGLEIEHQLKIGELNDRKVCGLFAFENPAYVRPNLAPRADKVRSITRKCSRCDRRGIPKHRRHAVARGQQYDWCAPHLYKTIRCANEAASRLKQKLDGLRFLINGLQAPLRATLMRLNEGGTYAAKGGPNLPTTISLRIRGSV